MQDAKRLEELATERNLEPSLRFWAAEHRQPDGFSEPDEPLVFHLRPPVGTFAPATAQNASAEQSKRRGQHDRDHHQPGHVRDSPLGALECEVLIDLKRLDGVDILHGNRGSRSTAGVRLISGQTQWASHGQ